MPLNLVDDLGIFTVRPKASKGKLQLEDDLGIFDDTEFKAISDYIRSNEGVSTKTYTDTSGNKTIGVGHLLKKGEKVDDIEETFKTDVKGKIETAKSLFPKFNEYPLKVKQSLVDGIFRGEYKKGQKTVDYINKGEWDKVPNEYINRNDYRVSKASEKASKPITGVYKRMDRNADIFRNYALTQTTRPQSTKGTDIALRLEDDLGIFKKSSGATGEWSDEELMTWQTFREQQQKRLGLITPLQKTQIELGKKILNFVFTPIKKDGKTPSEDIKEALEIPPEKAATPLQAGLSAFGAGVLGDVADMFSTPAVLFAEPAIERAYTTVMTKFPKLAEVLLKERHLPQAPEKIRTFLNRFKTYADTDGLVGRIMKGESAQDVLRGVPDKVRGIVTSRLRIITNPEAYKVKGLLPAPEWYQGRAGQRGFALIPDKKDLISQILKVSPKEDISKLSSMALPALQKMATELSSGGGTIKNIKFVRSGDAVGKEYHETIQAIDNKTGEVLGYVDYVYTDKQNFVKMIDVKPEHKRKGVGTALLNEMQKGSKKPVEMVGDYMTNEGKAFFSAYKSKLSPKEGGEITVYIGKQEGKPQGKYVYGAENKEYAKNFGENIQEQTITPQNTFDLTPLKETSISFDKLAKTLKDKSVEIDKSIVGGDDVYKPAWQWIRKYPVIADKIKEAGFDSIKQLETFTGKGKNQLTYQVLDNKILSLKETYEGAKTPIVEAKRISPITIKPDISGITPLQKQIQAMSDRTEKVQLAKDSLKQIDSIRQSFSNRIRKYKGEHLKEELQGIPSHYITREGGISIDEAMEELRGQGVEINNESDLKEYLTNLDNQSKSLKQEIEEYRPKFITKKETTLLEDKIKAVEMGFRSGGVKTLMGAKKAQNELIALLEESGLEANDKAKFLRTVKNIQSIPHLERAMSEITDRIQTLKDTAYRRETIEDLRDMFKTLPTKDLPLEYKERIESIQGLVELKRVLGPQQKRLESMRQFVERAEANGEEINIPPEKLALLDRPSLNNLTTDELVDMKEAIQRLRHLGSLKNKLLTAQQDRTFNDMVSEIVIVVTKSKGLSEEGSLVAYLKDNNQSLIGKSRREIYDYILKNLRPEVLINALDDYNKGLPTKVIWDIFNKANTDELEGGFASTRRIWDIHEDVNVPGAYVKKYNIGRFKGVTKDTVMYVYAHSQNDISLNHLYGSGLTDEDIKAFEDFLSPQEKQAVNSMWEYYDKEQWPRLDKVYSELEGTHLGKEENYFPIQRLERNPEGYGKDLEQDLLKRNYIRRASISKGFTKERVSSATAAFTDFSYFKTMLRNHEQVEHYIAFAKAVRDVRKVMYNTSTKAAITQRFGKEYYQTLDRWFKDVSYGGSKADMTFLDKMSSFLTENYVTSVLGYNLLSSLKSGASYLTGVDMVGTQASLKGLLKFTQNPLAIIRFVNSKSPFMRHRDFVQEREWKKILAGREAYLGQARVWQKFKEVSTFPMMFGDKITVMPLWISAYDDYVSRGFSERESIEWADTVIRRTQPVGQAIYLPEVFRSPGISKTYTLFTNQLNQNFNREYEQSSKFFKGGIGPKEYAKTQLYLMVLSGLLIGYLARRRAPTVKEFISDSVSQVSGGLFMVGRLVDSLGRAWAKGETARLGEALSPITFKPAESIGYALTAKKPETRKKHAFIAASLLTGIPWVELKRVAEGEPIWGKDKSKQETDFVKQFKKDISSTSNKDDFIKQFKEDIGK